MVQMLNDLDVTAARYDQFSMFKLHALFQMLRVLVADRTPDNMPLITGSERLYQMKALE